MSRQAQVTTEIIVKDEISLKEAVLSAAAEIGGEVVNKIRYYTGEVLGIKSGYQEIGVIVNKNGKLSFVGEDMHLNSDIGKKIQKMVKQGYNAIQVSKALGLMGYKVTPSRQNTALKFLGVKN